MPEISRFYGILIKMYYNDHAPPHFHAVYGEHKAVIRIADFGVEEGKLPPRALSLVIEWASLHQQELEENWQTITNPKAPSFKKIAPLK